MLQEIPGLRRWTTVAKDFPVLAHLHQEAPGAANNGRPWTTWLVLGGRGAGKTRLGAEWVRALAHGTPPYADRPCSRIALVGESEHDVREVMIEGLRAVAISPRAERPVWTSSRGCWNGERGGRAGVLGRGPGKPARAAVRCRLVRRAANGASGERPSTCCSSLAAWARPRQLITTTPRPMRCSSGSSPIRAPR
jgi:phage terminase large subunit-like protein